MSAIVRTRRRGNAAISTAALWLGLGLAVTFFAVRYGQELLLAHDLSDKASAQRIANSSLQDENSRLQAQLEYYHSDKYIEQRAREDLNLRRSDEEVLIPLVPDQATTGQTDTQIAVSSSLSIAEAPMPTPQRANWQKWLDLFSPAP